MLGLIRADIREIRAQAEQRRKEEPAAALPLLLRRPEDVKKPPPGFLFHRAALFLGLSSWLLYGYLWWWFPSDDATLWVPFAIFSGILVTASIYLRIRHPLPADVDF
jgi:hypothetical protein